MMGPFSCASTISFPLRIVHLPALHRHRLASNSLCSGPPNCSRAGVVHVFGLPLFFEMPCGNASANLQENAYVRAVDLFMSSGYSLKYAIDEFRNGTNTTTLYQWVKATRQETEKLRMGRPCTVLVSQEKELAELCFRFAARGAPIDKKETTTLVQDTFWSSQTGKFTNRKPRKGSNISFSKTSKQASERFASTNAEVLTSHIDSLGIVLNDLNIDSQKLLNLDKCGMSAGRDCHGASTRRVFIASGTICDRRSASFGITVSRSYIPYRTIIRDDQSEYTETVASLLPAKSPIATKPERREIDTALFISWCQKFEQRVVYLTMNSRKLLLFYDGYRSHTSFKALKVLSEGNVEAYALPSHTTGVT
eukprot:IDg18214t1